MMQKGALFFFLIFLAASPPLLAEESGREKAQAGVGESLMGLQEGVRGVVTGIFGIGEHSVKFLYYGSRDGVRTLGRGAKKTDSFLQEKLW